MKKGTNGLNDCFNRGPTITPELCGMLIQFRMYPIVVVVDVEKPFLQISLQTSDKDVTRCLWLKDSTKVQLDGNIQSYHFGCLALELFQIHFY